MPAPGKLHFVKFETANIEQVLDFIEAKGLLRGSGDSADKLVSIKATGGGAFKYAELFEVCTILSPFHTRMGPCLQTFS